jgi:hypothetical protein
VVLTSGCLGFVHPIHSPQKEDLAACTEVPAACKNRVHIFLINGLDPFEVGNLKGLQDYLHSLGFIKTWYGQPFHAFLFAKEILKIHAEEPTARFVLIGFSYGAGLARDVVDDMCKAGIPADLLVYIDGVDLTQRRLDRPHHALRVINILSCYRDAERKLEAAENMQYDDVWHFGAPTHPKTLKMLAEELAVVALRVPIEEPMLPPRPPEELPPHPTPRVLPPPLPGPGTLPPPRPASPPPPEGDWKFLEPDGTTGVSGKKPISDAWATEPGARER